MTVKSICDMDKALIVHHHYHGDFNKQELATRFGTSPRTIQRILVEMGVAESNEKYAANLQAYMRIINNYCLNPEELAITLYRGTWQNKPTAADVQEYLNTCSKTEIAGFLYNRLISKVMPTRVTPPLLTHTGERTSVN